MTKKDEERSLQFKCTNCGAMHGGSMDRYLCHNCYKKLRG